MAADPQSSAAAYDAIAQEYKASKQLPFRIHVEAFTLAKLLGDVRGLAILDLACGEGIYSRMLRRHGAARVVGVDLSPGMIALAQSEERRDPLGCEYLVGDAATAGELGKFDVVLGSYLLNYARSPEMLTQFATTIRANLKPGGRFVGINDNPAQDPSVYPLCEPYGFTKVSPSRRREGDPITYTISIGDGRTCSFDNYYLDPGTIIETFRRCGFAEFRWEGPWLAPGSESGFGEGYWNDFMAYPPIVGVSAVW